MIAGLSRTLMDEFYRNAADAERRKMLLRERVQEESERYEEARLVKIKRDEEEHERTERALSALATPRELDAFNHRLDTYDASTVAALLENRRSYDQAQDRFDRLRDDAFRLPDGRRVFPSAKGDEVFDENGTRLDRDVIDPAAIPPGRPTREAYVSAQEERRRLEQEHAELLAYQEKVDAAREKAGKEGVSKKELDDLDAELKAGVPSSVRDRLPHDGNVTPTASPGSRSAEPGVDAQFAAGTPRTPQAYRP